ncbi:DUF805 domain-containing protein [Niveispirillum sp. BGYR6]|uniref:DUF805 domain-containing protein n=1 Tax=Niveispirillum sp. BGYR6 TaxID=2971249 RepID=UPI0022B94C2E|nr:DUF805 domain-containing protein [Niveispirillum sp. BGYR6]MDG5495728.1 DUF805 domain-containing protein [Niveispirillum sp. BGYR6]
MFVLFTTIIAIILGVVDGVTGMMVGNGSIGVLGLIYSLALFIPSLAVGIRRLHDSGRSGWWTLICLVPLLGAIVLIVFYCMDSEAADNQYGPNPKLVTA